MRKLVPIGVLPISIHQQQIQKLKKIKNSKAAKKIQDLQRKRFNDVKQAIERYLDGDYTIEPEWITEYNELCKEFGTEIKAFLGAKEDTKEKTFLLIHDHRFGVSTFTIRSSRELVTQLTERSPAEDWEKDLIAQLDISFEPDRGESIEIIDISEENPFKF